MYSFDNKEFLLVSKQKIVNQYFKYVNNANFHQKISELIINYQNNRIYKPFFKQLFSFPSSVVQFTGLKKFRKLHGTDKY